MIGLMLLILFLFPFLLIFILIFTPIYTHASARIAKLEVGGWVFWRSGIKLLAFFWSIASLLSKIPRNMKWQATTKAKLNPEPNLLSYSSHSPYGFFHSFLDFTFHNFINLRAFLFSSKYSFYRCCWQLYCFPLYSEGLPPNWLFSGRILLIISIISPYVALTTLETPLFFVPVSFILRKMISKAYLPFCTDLY